MSERALVLSLLRAGDALVHLPAIAALARPERELHLLLQPASRPVAELLAPYATLHFLPANHAGDDPAPVAAALDALAAERFDVVFNLTHRTFAARLAARLGVARVVGLAAVGDRFTMTTPWFDYLNDWGCHAMTSVIHYGDVYCQAVGAPWTDPALRERLGLPTERAASERPLVALQATTSEAKKSWPPARWRALVVELRRRLPEARLVFLAAPSEREAVQAIAGEAEVAVCSLREAAALLAEARLLVTGDTALVHLGALVGAPVLLLSMGSSAFRELGPHGDGHVVLQADLPCAPCAHDPGCLLGADHPCVREIDPAAAAFAAVALATGGEPPAGRGMIAWRAGRDGRGLLAFSPLGPRPVETAAIARLREHLLAALPVEVTGSPAAPTPEAVTDGERATMAALAGALGALGGWLGSGDRVALEAVFAKVEQPFCLEVLRAFALRARTARERGGSLEPLRAEVARLERRLRAAA